MATREIRICLSTTPDFDGGRLTIDGLAITARYSQETGQLEPETDGGTCSLWHGYTQRPVRIPLECAVRLLGGMILSDRHLLSESVKAWLSDLVDDVIQSERDDAAQYGEAAQ